MDLDREVAFPPQAVTLCLADDVDVSRGDPIAHPNNVPRVERAIEAMAVWMDEAPLEVLRAYRRHEDVHGQGHLQRDRLSSQPGHAAPRVR